MKMTRTVVAGACVVGLFTACAWGGDVLREEYELAGARSEEPRYYVMEIDRTDRTVAGCVTERGGTRLMLEYLPGSGEWVCRRFEVFRGDGAAMEIASVAGLRYTYTPGFDEAGQVFGIDHSRFDGLTDVHGHPLTITEHYWVYNTFIDFHGFTDYFVSAAGGGGGIQDLTRVGDRVVHEASGTRAPVDLNDTIGAGSTFVNGEIVLSFDGIGLVNDRACALVGIDSGDCSLEMSLEPMPGVSVDVVGYSRYRGVCSVDIETRWLERFAGSEVVSTVSVAHTSGGEFTTNAVSTVERRIESVTAEVFEGG